MEYNLNLKKEKYHLPNLAGILRNQKLSNSYGSVLFDEELLKPNLPKTDGTFHPKISIDRNDFVEAFENPVFTVYDVVPEICKKNMSEEVEDYLRGGECITNDHKKFNADMSLLEGIYLKKGWIEARKFVDEMGYNPESFDLFLAEGDFNEAYELEQEMSYNRDFGCETSKLNFKDTSRFWLNDENTMNVLRGIEESIVADLIHKSNKKQNSLISIIGDSREILDAKSPFYLVNLLQREVENGNLSYQDLFNKNAFLYELTRLANLQFCDVVFANGGIFKLESQKNMKPCETYGVFN